MAVFTDAVGGRNITIGNVADWSQAANLPNGDSSSSGDGSIAASTYTGGDAFHFGNGSPWSLELWWYQTSASNRAVLVNSNVGASAIAWYVFTFTAGHIRFGIFNTGVALYMSVDTGTIANSQWHHFVLTKAAGADMRLYQNSLLISSTTSTSGTPQAPSSSYRLYLGTHGDGGNSLSSDVRIAKVAIYQKVLSAAEIERHYVHMVAT